MQHVIVPKSYQSLTRHGPYHHVTQTEKEMCDVCIGQAVDRPRLEALLRVAAVQLPRLSAEDRAALLPYVKREMGR